MDIPVEKLLPRAVVLGIVLYCIWPSISALTSEPQAQEPKKVPELTASMLSPTLPPPLARDPFGGISVPPWALARQSNMTSSTDNTSAKDKTAEAQAAKTVVQKKAVKETASRTSSPAAKNAKDVKAKMPDKQTEQLDALTLDATYIAGDRRLAVIDGHIYRQHDVLQSPADTTQCVVAEIFPDKVFLKTGNRMTELKYSTPTSTDTEKNE